VSHQYAVPKAGLQHRALGHARLQGGAHGPQGLSTATRIGRTAKDARAPPPSLATISWSRARAPGAAARGAPHPARQRKDGGVTLPWTSPPIINGTVQGTAEGHRDLEGGPTSAAPTISGSPRSSARVLPAGEHRALARQGAPICSRSTTASSAWPRRRGRAGGGHGRARREAAQNLQRDDRGCRRRGERSSSFATGQALYSLRRLGLTDRDASIRARTRWLIGRQDRTRRLSDEGYDKAEAMWAVLGLVSIDVVTIDVARLQEGQHLDRPPTLTVSTRDNQGGGVVSTSIDLDDRRVRRPAVARWRGPGRSPRYRPGPARARDPRHQPARRGQPTVASRSSPATLHDPGGSRFADGTTSCRCVI